MKVPKLVTQINFQSSQSESESFGSFAWNQRRNIFGSKRHKKQIRNHSNGKFSFFLSCFLSFFLGSPVSLGPQLFLILMTIFKRRWVICSKKLLDTKISLAFAIICNCSKIKKVSIQADASFRPKCTTARIATARQKHWKMSTAQIWLKKVEKSGTCMAVQLKNRVG